MKAMKKRMKNAAPEKFNPHPYSFLITGEHDTVVKKTIAAILRRLSRTNVLRPLAKRGLEAALAAISYGLSSKGHALVFYALPNNPETKKIMELIRNAKERHQILLHDYEAYQVFMTVKKTLKVEGDIAEVGVFRGGSAKIICEAKGHRRLHLFDTFEGIPHVSEIDRVYKGQLAASPEDVKNALREYGNVHVYKGVFPETAGPIVDKKFSFVHLDVDAYESTRNCLKFFYSRMTVGGTIISHNYGDIIGVRKAFDEFFADKLESVVELACTQCLVVKVSSLEQPTAAGASKEAIEKEWLPG